MLNNNLINVTSDFKSALAITNHEFINHDNLKTISSTNARIETDLKK